MFRTQTVHYNFFVAYGCIFASVNATYRKSVSVSPLFAFIQFVKRPPTKKLNIQSKHTKSDIQSSFNLTLNLLPRIQSLKIKTITEELK